MRLGMAGTAMKSNDDLLAIARDPLWLADRYDAPVDRVRFRHVTRAEHDRATFLTDEYLPAGGETVDIGRALALSAGADRAPLHHIFHSAFCCSTLLARAFDLAGVAMGLKEPVILNDLVGWRRRGAAGPQVARALDAALALLQRPFAPGEAVVCKPSNIVNGLADVMLAMRPESQALLLYAPLPVYLGSVARKGMEGRLWVRELLEGLLREGAVALGMTPEDHLRQTDLQVAAVGWLAQHALFARLAAKYPGRVRTLDSATLTARPAEAMTALARHYRLPLDETAVAAIVAGPAFTRHSKFGRDFAIDDREAELRAGAAVHADEVGKVAIWAEAVADAMGVPMDLPAPLLA
jgi:hypothetical protein